MRGTLNYNKLDCNGSRKRYEQGNDAIKWIVNVTFCNPDISKLQKQKPLECFFGATYIMQGINVDF